MLSNLYPISTLFFYRLILMGWMLFAEGLFLFRYEKKSRFPLRLTISILGCFAFALAFPIPVGVAENAFYSILMYFCFFFVTYAFSIFTFQEDPRLLFFSCICGYTAEHISYEVYFSLTNFFVYDSISHGNMYDTSTISFFEGPLDTIFYFFSYIIIYWLVFVFFANRIQKDKTSAPKGAVKVLIAGALFLVIDIAINCAANAYAKIHFENNYMGLLALINAISCLIGLFYIFEMFYSNHIQKEYEIMRQIRNEERAQYQISKQTIDLINVKCHDLKHQIRKIGSEEHIDEGTIKNISNLIDIYDSSIKTSNQALNVILNEKSLFCARNGIKFSCIADGSLLNFMEEEDIYSLFGNLIDNAIEAVEHIDEEKRIIRIKVTKQGNMISLSVKNYFEGKVEIENGLPLTSKKDRDFHGFGLRSVQMVAEKYKGVLKVVAEDSVFTVTILFLQEN